jgi:hypothetical protein
MLSINLISKQIQHEQQSTAHSNWLDAMHWLLCYLAVEPAFKQQQQQQGRGGSSQCNVQPHWCDAAMQLPQLLQV